jgi:hypothetical protein
MQWPTYKGQAGDIKHNGKRIKDNRAQTTQWSTYKGQARERKYNGQHMKDKQGTENTMVNI